MKNFKELGIEPVVAQSVESLGYARPTPIQAAVIPLLLAGHDVIGQAQTGTGKTAAFALPIIQRLESGKKRPQALVITPTRELAIQVSEAVDRYGSGNQVRAVAIYGGQSYEGQIRQLKRGAQVVVGTPGRLIDLLNQKKLDLGGIQTVVLDEADEMLSMGFIEDIERLLAALPDNKQVALFSATMPAEIQQLARQYLRQPQIVTIVAEQLTVKEIEQRVYLVREEDKLSALTRLFETEEITSALIFTRTRVETGRVATELSRRGFPAESLSGDLTQTAREHVLERFTGQKVKVLVATDIAARGLDIDHISHVFNYDVPQFPEIYVHRVGRTGRAGKSGVAITLISPRERGRLRNIEGYSRQKLKVAELPTEEEIWAQRDQKILDRMLVWLNRDRYKKEKQMVEDLIDEGFDPKDLAAAALKMARVRERMRPIEKITPIQADELSNEGPPARDRRRRGRAQADQKSWGSSRKNESASRPAGNRREGREPGMVRFRINVGRNDGVRPGDIVREVAVSSGIQGGVIGAIIINQENTLFDVPQGEAHRVKNPRQKIDFWDRPVVVELH